MRALAAQGFFVHVGDQRFAHTSFSRTLRSDCPLGVRNLTLLGGSEWNWAAWGGLADTVRTGVPAFIARYGKDLYSYFAEDAPEAGVIFNRSMSESGRWTSGPVADALDVTGLKTVADVGGGEGGLLRMLLDRHRNLRGVLVDSEHVVGQADPDLREGTLAARCEIVPADIRTAVPCVADLYVLRQVMHIWDDDMCVQILRNCLAGASPGVRIVLVEHLVNDDPEQKPTPAFTTQIDLLMMLIGRGRERTREDFARIMAEAGLEFSGTTATPLPLHLITGVLAG